MKRAIFWIVVFVLAFGLSALVVFACGKERWAVKTSADKDAQRVNFNPIVTTVRNLVELPAPTREQLDAHPDTRLVSELNTYTVQGYLVGFKLETDEDFHIVLADPTDDSKTMIVEMPSAACVPDSIRISSNTLRTTWEARFGKALPRFKKEPPRKVKIEVTGVGFFDFLHGQTGVAPNGFELHRLLNWKEVK